MKVLVVNHRDIFHPYAGGSEVVIYEVSKRLMENGIEIHWLSENTRLEGRNEIDGIKLIHKGNKVTLHFHSLKYAKNYDVVMDSVAHAVPFFSYLVNKRTVALVHHVHQYVVDYELSKPLAYVVKKLERYLKKYKRIIAVSHSTKLDLIKLLKIDEHKIEVIHNGVDHDKFRPGEKSPEPMILWIGRLKRYKNPLHAIKIFKMLKTKAKLIIVGKGEKDIENQIIQASSSSDNIIYLGRIPEDQKIKLYQSAWVVLSTSFIEGWGMTITEANASGTPAVAYSVGSLPEIIQHGKNGFLVDYEDYTKAAEYIDYILSDENIMKKCLWIVTMLP
nr:glycosyltransferase family 4 protein [Sulfolobus acidocaldarius]